jgi:uncharacterized protein
LSTIVRFAMVHIHFGASNSMLHAPCGSRESSLTFGVYFESSVPMIMLESSELDSLRKTIHEAAELLPSQGPITAFAFLNPLQGLESQPFDAAMKSVKKVYGAEPYLSEVRYFAKLQRGRITVKELEDAIKSDLGDESRRVIGGLCNLLELRMALLGNAIHCGVDRELDWLIAESATLDRFREDVPAATKQTMLECTRRWVANSATNPHYAIDAVTSNKVATHDRLVNRGNWETVCLQLLWTIIRTEVSRVIHVQKPDPDVRHRDLLRKAKNVDCDQWVHELLVRFCSAFLDQGQAQWSLPCRDEGFFRAFIAFHSQRRVLRRKWERGLPAELDRIVRSGMTPLQSIEESLTLLGVRPEETFDYICASLLALRGFAGMIWQTEIRPDRVAVPSPPDTLIEFLAVRLILDRLALSYWASEPIQEAGSLGTLREYLTTLIEFRPEVSEEQQAYILFQLAQLLGWSPQRLAQLEMHDWWELSHELSRFSSHERRRTFHLAFESRVIYQALDAISNRIQFPPIRPPRPKLQVITCIDAREESFRRHLEEVDDDIETFGIAGFFGVPMYYRGAGDAHFASLAPIVIRPKHWVAEEVVFSFEEASRTRARVRQIIGAASRSLHAGTRGFIGGAIVSTFLGPLATAPLLSRVLFPRLTGLLHRTAKQFVAPPAVTRLHLDRLGDDPPGKHDDGLGFTVEEMAKMAEQSLRDIGLVSNFARLVVFMGHGTSCLNNPHESSYHCGACCGSPGGPNARALAAMLNDLRVRRILQEKGIAVPDDTYFIGALHNTAKEQITFYDLELLPSSQIAGMNWAKQILLETAKRNAHERCRRFESAPLSISPEDALLHVQARAEDLAQTRPEYGNSTNALCFVGRRSRIRGLFLDRRSFLMSYDPTLDSPDTMVLKRILSAVVPVCQGINSLYTFSALDASGWGAGTKLPHNITSLLGVMDGAASDLRTGVPWQGIDIHEPVRLQFVIETTPEKLLVIADSNPVIAKIFRNQWAHFATLDPNTSVLHRYLDGKFVEYKNPETTLRQASSSLECYRANRDHLPFARIVKS